jgi:hypothetical protein
MTVKLTSSTDDSLIWCALAITPVNPFRKKIITPDKVTLEETEKILNEIINAVGTAENIEKKTTVIDDTGPLCDPVDFDQQDSYCKECPKFKRCLERSNS